jgi:ankyrin repeat protein
MNALLAAGAKPDPGIVGWNRVGMSALELAAKVDRAEAYRTQSLTIDPILQLQILLQHGAKVDAVDARGLTPLRRAIGANNVDVVAFLIGAGADPNKAINVGDSDIPGYTPLMGAVLGYEWSRDPSLIRLLLDHGANPDFMTHSEALDPRYMGMRKYGETALTVAARKGFSIVVQDLLDHGADPALPREDGALPADIARKAGFPKLAELLIQAAATKSPAAHAP